MLYEQGRMWANCCFSFYCFWVPLINFIFFLSGTVYCALRIQVDLFFNVWWFLNCYDCSEPQQILGGVMCPFHSFILCTALSSLVPESAYSSFSCLFMMLCWPERFQRGTLVSILLRMSIEIVCSMDHWIVVVLAMRNKILASCLNPMGFSGAFKCMCFKYRSFSFI